MEDDNALEESVEESMARSYFEFCMNSPLFSQETLHQFRLPMMWRVRAPPPSISQQTLDDNDNEDDGTAEEDEVDACPTSNSQYLTMHWPSHLKHGSQFAPHSVIYCCVIGNAVKFQDSEEEEVVYVCNCR